VGWRESSSTPDWTDIRIMVRQLEKEYAAAISMTLWPAGGPFGNVWQLSVSAMWPLLGTQGNVGTCSATLMWPNRDNATMEGAMYRVLWELERGLGAQRFRNQRLV
jgi:hypothetical protein